MQSEEFEVDQIFNNESASGLSFDAGNNDDTIFDHCNPEQNSNSSIEINISTEFPQFKYQMEQLTYTVYSCSSHLQNYIPSNIIESRPFDPSSRWTSISVDPPQFITLKLLCPVILRQITFGKYEKAHACNMKRFKIYSGMTEGAINNEILDGTLRNDATTETFNLKHTIDGQPFASRFIKIVPIVAWGGTLNYTIWHVTLHGITDASIVSLAMKHFEHRRKQLATKLCLKFLRQSNYTAAFDALSQQANVSFEDEVLTKLHKHLVIDGDYDQVEKLLDQCFDNGYFDDHLSQQNYSAVWTLLEPKGHKDQRPGMRGGHQMAIDPIDQKVYLFGGWNGKVDLSDFWVCDVSDASNNEWTCLSPDTSIVGGPSPRSCHKMVLDHIQKKIYLLGRYLDSGSRTVENLKSDFFVYDIVNDSWKLICDDTASLGGPKLIFDHQLTIDTKNNKLYVFGGRVILPSTMPSDNSSTSISSTVLSPVSSISDSGHFTYDLVRSSTVVYASSSPPIFSPDATSESTGSPPIIETFNRHFNPERVNFSGMYSYDIESNSWKCLRRDSLIATTTQSLVSDRSKMNSIFRSTVRSRVGHSMVLHEGRSKLYIFAGQCNNEYMADFIEYDLSTDEVSIKTSQTSGRNPAESLTVKRDFTQRATIDEQLNEIYVFSGITNDTPTNSQSSTFSTMSGSNEVTNAKLWDMSQVKNSFWVYNLNRASWNCVYRNELNENSQTDGNRKCPCPRYAHALVYDKINKVHYLFGGNPGSNDKSAHGSNIRLDDFWSLKLIRPSPDGLRAKLIQLLRQVNSHYLVTFLV